MIEPPDWGGFELDGMRIVLGFVVLRERWLAGLRPQMRSPVGIARLVDLRPIVRGRYYRVARWAFDAAVVLYVAGYFLWATSLVAAVIAVSWLTASVSDAVVNHGRHLGALALVSTAAAHTTWEVSQLIDADLGRWALASGEATAAWWTVQAIVAAYFMSGVAKVALTAGRWVWRSPGLVIHMLARIGTAASETTHRESSLRRSATYAEWFGRHPGLSRVFFGGGLLVELLIPLSLVNRATLIVGGAALLVLHWMNGLALRLHFRAYQWLVVAYLLQAPYLMVELSDWFGLESLTSSWTAD